MRSKLLTLFMAVAVVVALAAELSVAAFAYQANANTSAPAKRKVKKHRKPASRAMAMPTTPEGCLNRLATLAARDPLPKYEGEPDKIINDGMLWPSGKCAVTDQAQRLKLQDLANKWRMNDAAGVRAALQGMGATASSTEMGSPTRMPRSRRGRRTPATEAPASSDTQATPPASTDTQAAPPTDEASGATNSNTRRARPRRRPARRNTNTANTNS